MILVHAAVVLSFVKIKILTTFILDKISLKLLVIYFFFFLYFQVLPYAKEQRIEFVHANPNGLRY